MRDDGLDGDDTGPKPDVRRADAVADLASRRGVRCDVLPAEGGCSLERLASLIAVPDFASATWPSRTGSTRCASRPSPR